MNLASVLDPIKALLPGRTPPADVPSVNPAIVEQGQAEPVQVQQYDARPVPFKITPSISDPYSAIASQFDDWTSPEPGASFMDHHTALSFRLGLDKHARDIAEMPAGARSGALASIMSATKEHAGMTGTDLMSQIAQRIADMSAAQEAVPTPQQISDQQRADLLAREYPDLPTKPHVTLAQIAQDALFSLGATRLGIAPGVVLGQVVQNRVAHNDQDWQEQVQATAIKAQRARAEHQMIQSDLDAANKYNVDRYNAHVDVAKGNLDLAKFRYTDHGTNLRLFQSANTPGEALGAATALYEAGDQNYKVAYGPDGMVKQEGTSPIVWAQYHNLSAKQKAADDANAIREQAVKESVVKNIATEFAGPMLRERAQSGGLTNPQDWIDQRNKLIAAHPEIPDLDARLPQVPTGNTLAQRRQDFLQRWDHFKFDHISAADKARIATANAHVKVAQDSLNEMSQYHLDENSINSARLELERAKAEQKQALAPHVKELETKLIDARIKLNQSYNSLSSAEDKDKSGWRADYYAKTKDVEDLQKMLDDAKAESPSNAPVSASDVAVKPVMPDVSGLRMRGHLPGVGALPAASAATPTGMASPPVSSSYKSVLFHEPRNAAEQAKANLALAAIAEAQRRGDHAAISRIRSHYLTDVHAK